MKNIIHIVFVLMSASSCSSTDDSTGRDLLKNEILKTSVHLAHISWDVAEYEIADFTLPIENVSARVYERGIDRYRVGDPEMSDVFLRYFTFFPVQAHTAYGDMDEHLKGFANFFLSNSHLDDSFEENEFRSVIEKLAEGLYTTKIRRIVFYTSREDLFSSLDNNPNTLLNYKDLFSDLNYDHVFFYETKHRLTFHFFCVVYYTDHSHDHSQMSVSEYFILYDKNDDEVSLQRRHIFAHPLFR